MTRWIVGVLVFATACTDNSDAQAVIDDLYGLEGELCAVDVVHLDLFGELGFSLPYTFVHVVDNKLRVMQPLGDGSLFLDVSRSFAKPYEAIPSRDLPLANCGQGVVFAKVTTNGELEFHDASAHLEVYADTERVIDLGLSHIEYETSTGMVSLPDLRITSLLQ